MNYRYYAFAKSTTGVEGSSNSLNSQYRNTYSYDFSHSHTLEVNDQKSHSHTVAGGDQETRPHNIAVIYVIQAKTIGDGTQVTVQEMDDFQKEWSRILGEMATKIDDTNSDNNGELIVLNSTVKSTNATIIRSIEHTQLTKKSIQDSAKADKEEFDR